METAAFAIAVFCFTVIIPTVVSMIWQALDQTTGLMIIGISALVGSICLFCGINSRRRAEGKAKIVIEPIHFIGLGLLIALFGIGWQIWKGNAGAFDPTLQSQLSELQSDFSRLVRPRELTEDQEEALESFLLKYPKHKLEIYIAPGNDEISSYAGQFANVFRRAQWPVTTTTANSSHEINEGLRIEAEHPPIPSDGSETPHALLVRALDTVGIPHNGSGSRSVKGLDDWQLKLIIGHKPRR